jgi:hypothetical protein
MEDHTKDSQKIPHIPVPITRMIYGRPDKGFPKHSPCTSSNYLSLELFLGGSILRCSQSGDVPQEDLVNFDYKLNMKVIF